jgi:DmsE family decaheme c-type cytochrome
LRAAVPRIEGAEYVNDTEICMTCHEAYVKSFADNVHRRDNCEACHGPASRHVETRGKEPGLIFSFKCGDPIARAEACLRCHENNACTEGARWRTSKHASCGVTCVNCHRGHYDVPPGTPPTTDGGAATLRTNGQPIDLTSYLEARTAGQQPWAGGAPPLKPEQPSLRGTSDHLAAVAPYVCYQCHCDMKVYQEIAGPHQICGPNGFNCTTCHDPHGQIREETRKDLCLQCHNGAPTMAWHSCTHALNGVACTDCHNPHPRMCVPGVVDISHWQVQRPQRRQMAVDQPQACYKCHQKIYGLNALPSHHPIKEGKMVCTDCHDPHGQETDNLKEATVNLVCYKCHADKQGPFAFEHPPVRENCDICHNPHGTVANNLLKQPATFLCLRCHPGHYSGTRHPSSASDFIGIDKDPGVGTKTALSLRKPFFTNCTECHQQVHGTNRISQRQDPYFTR